MNSLEALKNLKEGAFIKCKRCDVNWLKGCRCCHNTLSNSEELKTLENDLKDYEWLKSKLNISCFLSLDNESQNRILKILSNKSNEELEK